MSILTGIVSRLRDFIKGVERHAEDTRERLEERQAESLATMLDELAKTSPYKNWRTSIEDLAYLVGEDGSYAGRKQLWSDLEMKGTYRGTDQQNIDLRARFLQELPSHGIPWPKDA